MDIDMVLKWRTRVVMGDRICFVQSGLDTQYSICTNPVLFDDRGGRICSTGGGRMWRFRNLLMGGRREGAVIYYLCFYCWSWRWTNIYVSPEINYETVNK